MQCYVIIKLFNLKVKTVYKLLFDIYWTNFHVCAKFQDFILLLGKYCLFQKSELLLGKYYSLGMMLKIGRAGDTPSYMQGTMTWMSLLIWPGVGHVCVQLQKFNIVNLLQVVFIIIKWMLTCSQMVSEHCHGSDADSMHLCISAKLASLAIYMYIIIYSNVSDSDWHTLAFSTPCWLQINLEKARKKYAYHKHDDWGNPAW